MTMVLRPPRKISEVYCTGAGGAKAACQSGGAWAGWQAGGASTQVQGKTPQAWPWPCRPATAPSHALPLSTRLTSSMARLESATYGTYLITTTWSGCSPGLRGDGARGFGVQQGRQREGCRGGPTSCNAAPARCMRTGGTGHALPAARLHSPVEDGVGLNHVVHHVGLGDLLGPERLAREGGEGRGDGWW